MSQHSQAKRAARKKREKKAANSAASRRTGTPFVAHAQLVDDAGALVAAGGLYGDEWVMVVAGRALDGGVERACDQERQTRVETARGAARRRQKRLSKSNISNSTYWRARHVVPGVISSSRRANFAYLNVWFGTPGKS